MAITTDTKAIDISLTEEVFSVSQLNRDVRFILEGNFPLVWVEGEISNLAIPGSNHWYFTLKDSSAQVRCAMFRNQNRHLTFTPTDGSHVLIKARVSLYEGRGDFQLIADYMEEMGEGRLRQAFERLKNKLLKAGLFADQHKQSLPQFVQTIGIITSPTGAAVRDVLSVLKRRYPIANVIIYPTLTQGHLAAENIVKAIQTANLRRECNALILTRGGGSLEDLWPFNEEIVAQAIYHSELPVISAVGHEIDFTISDFVADLRAATPTAAAELLTPERKDLLAVLNKQRNQLSQLIHVLIRHQLTEVIWYTKHLQQLHPRQRLEQQQQQLDIAHKTLVRLQITKLTTHQRHLQQLRAHLYSQQPSQRLQMLAKLLQSLAQQLQLRLRQHIAAKQKAMALCASQLDVLSPLATLKRGYALVTCKTAVITDASQLRVGDNIDVRLSQGHLTCQVAEIEKN